MPNARLRDVVLLVALGGAIGTIARYELAQAIHPSTNGIPWATFIANLSGAFALGIFLTMLTSHTNRALWLRAFVAVGLLGGYTTFSTFTVESVLLVKNHHAGLGIVYFSSTIAAGIAVAWLGILLGRRLAPART